MADDSLVNSPKKGYLISLPARLEAILYLKGRPIKIKELADLSNETEEAVEHALLELFLN